MLADSTEQSNVKTPTATELLANLDDPNYRVRREALLLLCGSSYPINSILEAESQTSDVHRSRNANWLLKLRQASGNTSEKFAMMSDYQTILGGDISPLYQKVVDGKWNSFIELLRLLPPSTFKEQLNRESRIFQSDYSRFEPFIDQAWKSGNEWAVPQILDVIAPMENRVAINAWWRELGMPAEWKVSEPDDPRIKIYQLAQQGKVKEALNLASQNGFKDDFDRLALTNDKWEEWIKGSTQNKVAPANSIQTRLRMWAFALAQNDFASARSEWEEIKKIRSPQKARGLAALSLIMNDSETFEQAIKELPPPRAFELLARLGRPVDALRRVGLEQLTSEACRKWAKTKESLFFYNASESELSLLNGFVSAIHQLGMPEVEAAFDDVWRESIRKQEGEYGPAAMRQMLQIWKFNQRDKALAYLKNYSKRNAKSVTIWLNLSKVANDVEDNRASYMRCFEILFGKYLLSDAALVFERILAMQKGKEFGESIDEAFVVLEDLYQGRKPASWQDLEPLKTICDGVQPMSMDDTTFNKSMALLYDALGDTKQAISLLQDYMGQPGVVTDDFYWLISQYIAKSGDVDSAATVLVRIAEYSDNLITFLKASEMLERAGRFTELDQLRIRKLSMVSPRLETTIAFLDELSYERPETEWVFDRMYRINWKREFNFSDVWYQIAKRNIAKAPYANRLATSQFLQMANGFIDREDGMKFSKSIASFALQAIHKKDEKAFDEWITMGVRLDPTNIQFPIDLLPEAEKVFPKERVDAWFELYWKALHSQLEQVPNDAMTLNNTAWMASQCNRRLEDAFVLSKKAVELRPDPTYMDTLADIEFRRGNIDKAIEISQRCREIEPREDQHRKQIRRFSQAVASTKESH